MISWPSTVIESSPASTGTSRLPSTESCLSRWAIVFVSPMSFAATISKSPPCWSWARRKFLPMRPKPLIPTLVLAISRAPLVVGCQSSLTARLREKSVALRSLRAASAQVGGRTGKLRGRPSRPLTCSRPGDRRGLNPPPDEQEPAAASMTRAMLPCQTTCNGSRASSGSRKFLQTAQPTVGGRLREGRLAAARELRGRGGRMA